MAPLWHVKKPECNWPLLALVRDQRPDTEIKTEVQSMRQYRVTIRSPLTVVLGPWYYQQEPPRPRVGRCLTSECSDGH